MLSLIGRYSAEHALDVRVEQVKEKFGLLRTYIRGGDVVTNRILDVAELVSGCVCEKCGMTGKYFEANGFLQVRCLQHQLPNQSDVTVCEYSEVYSVSFAKAVSLVLWFFRDQYANWLKEECLALGRVRPVEALTTVEGCHAVYDLLKRIEYGVNV
ncbi:hypothetical protein CXQ80_08035 [Pseudomonas sp. 02C 26]|nr:hypothetical protein CXQ80_08035 [Pseudomonas sp. 02C 26]